MIRHLFRHSLTALAAIAALAACASAFAFTPPPFPRIAGVQYGSPFNYNDPTYQAKLAKQSITLLNWWPGMEPGGESMDSVIQAIKAINPNALVFLYAESDYQSLTAPDSDAWTALRSKINSMKWWLYNSTSDSSAVASLNSSTYFTINNTPNTPKDSSGEDSVDWITRWLVSQYYTANPHMDGLFMDNVFVHPNIAGDWYRDGVVLQPSDPKAAAALQSGYERYFSLAEQLMPGKYQLGNVATWGQNTAVPGGYVGMANGGLLEGIMGASWSIEAWGGWQEMMSQYNSVMQAMAAPKLVIFNQYGSSTDYQSLRYGLASCLMNNGYYSFTDQSAGGYSGVVWFDEYNANLGQPTTQPTAAWQKGVWRRDFTNGIALVNPKGNGPQTVQLGGTFVKIKGSQDAAINNGQTVTSVTLQDRDGLILLRQSPIQQPNAPTGVSIGGS